jgi:hypothetical protein
VAGLAFAHELVGFRIEEIRVRVQGAEHGGNRAAKDGVVRIHFVGEVRFDGLENLGELFDACVQVRLGLSR